MRSIQKWKLLTTRDISPSSWFPLEKRTYELPSGKIVDDFYVTPLADVSLIVPFTKEGKVVLVKQFKQGVDEITLEFPAGRKESHHDSMESVAMHELAEETGIKVSSVEYFATLTGFTTKASERVYCYFVRNAVISGHQNLDENEAIQVMLYTPQELDQLIKQGKMLSALSIAAWYLAKQKFFIQ
jgi:8-oxo-dGTP pyrophosphatase MutT (NUDIX family)